ncbi:hypothetical protein ABID16_001969 [Rhizobium aquaticum]|uniref:Uncharacterized protein n=1 Tax=Rhizobium aquaticum TaxID=1549636 RepID=A0ABV2J0V1_9HYPH
MTEQAPTLASVLRRHFGALCIMAGATAVGTAFCALASLTVTDVLHVAVFRTKSDTLDIVIYMTPLLSMLGALTFIWIMWPAQMLQGFLSWRYGQRWYVIALATPALVALTFSVYDYLTPDLSVINPADDWEPYRHGLTVERFLRILVFQLPVSIYTALYVFKLSTGGYRRLTLATPFFVAAVLGGIGGYYLGQGQLKLDANCAPTMENCQPSH